MRWQSFRGTVESAALGQPFVAPRHLQTSGVLLGADRRTRKLVVFDPQAMKHQRIIHSMVFWILGQKDYGKSTLLKSLAIRLSMLQVGIDDIGNAIEPVVRMHSRKPEDGESENQRVVEFMQSQTIHMAEEASINVLDPAMNLSEVDIIETVVDICEQVAEEKLSSFQPLAIQVAVSKMLTLGEQASLELLQHCANGLTVEDIDIYFSDRASKTRDMFSSSLVEDVTLASKLQLLFERPPNVPIEEVQRSGAIIAQYLGWVTAGGFGSMFGGKNSLRDALSQSMVNIDWSGVNRGRSLAEYMMAKWETAALHHHDLELIPHIDIGDEEAEAMINLMHARAQASYVKKARAFHKASFRATQYLSDLTEAGAAGSEIRSLSQGIVLGVGCWFIFRQPNNDDVLHGLTNLGLEDKDAKLITQQEVGQYAIFVPGKAPIFCQHVLTPTEEQLVQTDAATRRTTQRIPVLSQKEITRISKEQGTINLWEDDAYATP